jgi:hypothetical protein
MLRRVDARKERKKRFWMGALLVFLMVFSVMGILIGSRGGESWDYNGYTFTRDGIYFVTEINDEQMAFNYLPNSLQDINVTPNLRSKLTAPMMYISFNPEHDIQDLYYIELIRRDLELSLNTIVISAVDRESEVYSLPIMGCENATPYVPVFYFNISNTTSITDNNGCIVLNGRNVDFYRMRDLILYTMYGVIDG